MKNLKQLTITILNYNRIHNLSKVIYQIYPTIKIWHASDHYRR